MQFQTKRTFLPIFIKQLKRLVTYNLIFVLVISLGLPLRQASAQGECSLQCSATVPATGTAGTAVNFASTTTASSCAAAVNIDWDFGDGTAHSNQANTTHSYAGPGTYTWQMTATANTNVTTIDTIAGGYGEGAPVRQASFTVPTVIARDPLGRGLFVVDESASGNFVWFINMTADAVMLAGKKIEAGTRRALTNSSAAVPSPDIFDVNASQVGIVATGLAMSNDGNLLYIGDASSSIVWVYNISGSDQTVFGNKLSSGNVGALAFVGGAGVGAIAVHPTTGEVYFVGSQSNRVYKIIGLRQTQVVAGNGAATQPSDKFPEPPVGQVLNPTMVPLLNPRDIAFDSTGILYIADTGHARVVRIETGGALTLLKQFPLEPFNPYPVSLAVIAGGPFKDSVAIANGNQQTIVLQGPSVGTIIAGQENVTCDYTTSKCGDGGLGINARFNLQNSANTPPLVGIESDANGLYILDQGNSQRGRIRYLNLSTSDVTILGQKIAANSIDTIAGNGQAAPFDNGLAISSVLNNPSGVAVDANGNLFIADTPSAAIRFVNRSKSAVTLFAGTAAERIVPSGDVITLNNEAGAGAGENTPINQATFDNPQGLFATGQGVYVADSKKGPVVDGKRTGLIRFINTSDAAVTFYAGSPSAITVLPGRIGTIAGGGQAQSGNGDGSFATDAKFLAPSDVAVHPVQKHIYVADVANRAVRKINGSTGIVTSLNLPESFYTGLGIDANGRLYIADYTNGQILREISAGSESFEKMNATPIANPRDVAVDANGNAFVVIGGSETDTVKEYKVLRIAAGGQVETVAGTTPGYSGDGGPAANAQLATFASPITLGGINPGPFFPQTINISLGANGEVIFADTGNDRIRRIGQGVMTCFKTGTIAINGNYPIPVLSKLGPNFVLPGRPATLMVTGTGFTPASMVRWNGQDRPTTFISATQLLAAISTSDTGTVGTAQVTVFNPSPGGGLSNSLTISVTQINPIPTVSSLAPTTVAVGTAFTLTVNGSNFVNNSVVYWNGSPRPTTFVSVTTLQAQIPASDLGSPGQVLVTVVNPEPGGGVSSATSFTITTTNAAPILTSLLPGVALTGSGQFLLTLTGRNFAVNSVVRWNGTDRPTTFINSTMLQALIPASDVLTAGTINVTVFTPTPGGGTTTGLPFFIGKQASTVPATSFNGNVVAPNSIAAIFGVGLATGTQVATALPLPTSLLNTTLTIRDANGVDRQAPLFFVSPGQINFLIPADTATGTATIVVKSGDNVVGVGVVQISALTPGLFTSNATGLGIVAGVALRISNGSAAVFEPLAQFNGSQYVAVPLDLGPETDQVYLVVYGSGLRARSELSKVTAKIGGVDVPVVYAGEAPGLVGADQVNIGPLPRSLAGRGAVDLVLTVDGLITNTVSVTIK